MRIQNPSKLLTNFPHLEVLRKKCAVCGPHKHERAIAWHDRDGPSYTNHTSAYPPAFNTTYARAAVSGWKDGFEPSKHALPYVPLEKLQENVGILSELLFPGLKVVDGNVLPKGVPMRPVSEKAPEPSSVANQPTHDFWVETDETWIWRHVVPRTTFVCPMDPDVPYAAPVPSTC